MKATNSRVSFLSAKDRWKPTSASGDLRLTLTSHIFNPPTPQRTSHIFKLPILQHFHATDNNHSTLRKSGLGREGE